MHMPKTGTTVLLALLAGASAAEAQQPASLTAKTSAAGTTRGSAKATIVLVDGAFADASGWQLLIPILQQDGYKVVAVQNAMGSLAGDVETTKRLIDAQSGPIVVVGHSYGGAVITGAAAGNANVKALVYLAAFAPEPGEPVAAFLEKYPVDLGTATVKDAAGCPNDRDRLQPRSFHLTSARSREGNRRGGGVIQAGQCRASAMRPRRQYR